MNDIEMIEWKIKMLQAKKKAIKKSGHIQNRKDRTRLLIQTGALCENYFGIENLLLSQREEIFKLFSPYIKNNISVKYIKKSSIIFKSCCFF